MNSHPDVTRELIRQRQTRLQHEAEAERLAKPASSPTLKRGQMEIAHLYRVAAGWVHRNGEEATARPAA